MFGFGKRKREEPEFDEEEDEIEPVRFLGATNGIDPNLSANARLVDAGLMRTKDLVTDAISRRCDTLRLDPRGEVCGITMAIDGIPYPGGRLSKAEGLAITQMLKLLAGLDIKQRKAEQSGGIKAEFLEKAYELRVVINPVPDGERLTLRINDLAHKLETPAELGMSDEQRKKIRELCSGKGIFVVCGPPGSGTTTTLWGVARGLDSFIYSIFTLQDPGGRKLHNIPSFEVNPGDDLETTITRAVRKESDVMILNPLKNADYVKQAFDGATELMLVAEMEARDIPSAVAQLIQWVGDAEKVTSNLKGLVTQKLIRVLCAGCKQAFRPNPEFISRTGLPDSITALYRPAQPPANPEENEDYAPCEQCGEIGFVGRTGMFEFLAMTDGIKKAILRTHKDPALLATTIRQVMRDEKQPTLQQDGLRLVAEGKTSLDELQRAFRPPAGTSTSGANRTASSGASKTTGASRPAAPGSKPPTKPGSKPPGQSGANRPPGSSRPPTPPPKGK